MVGLLFSPVSSPVCEKILKLKMDLGGGGGCTFVDCLSVGLWWSGWRECVYVLDSEVLVTSTRVDFQPTQMVNACRHLGGGDVSAGG